MLLLLLLLLDDEREERRVCKLVYCCWLVCWLGLKRCVISFDNLLSNFPQLACGCFDLGAILATTTTTTATAAAADGKAPR